MSSEVSSLKVDLDLYRAELEAERQTHQKAEKALCAWVAEAEEQREALRARVVEAEKQRDAAV